MVHIDIDLLIQDREAFNAFIYTPLDRALIELAKRSQDKELEQKIAILLPSGIPIPLAGKNGAVLFRQVATPNYETRRFISIIDAIDELAPVIWEYYSDKFTSNNECKHALGKLHFYLGKGKKGGAKIEHTNILDFNRYNGKKIEDVKTLSGGSLIDFHHELFEKTYRKLDSNVFFDASEWFEKSGGSAQEYYMNFLLLFIQNGILFENFMLDKHELSFTKNVFLPAFIAVMNETGVKPLIVPLEPTNIEGDKFWLCYPPESRDFVNDKIKLLY